MMLLQLSVDLLHRLQTNADDNEERRAAEGHLRTRQLQRDDRQGRQEGDDHQVQRAGRRDSVDHIAQVLSRGTARAIPGDEASVLLHVVRDLIRVERDRRVEEGEEQCHQGVDRQVERGALREVRRNPLDPPVLGLAELGNHRRQRQDRRREDDRDNAGHVDLEGDVRGRATVLTTTDHPLGVLHRDAALRLLNVDDGDGDEKKERHDSGDRAPLAGLTNGEQLLGQAGGDGGEDQQGHAVADATLGDELAEPHDDAGAGHHDDNHHDEGHDGAIADDVLGAGLEELSAARQRNRRRRLEDTQEDRQVARVLGELGLPGLPLLVQVVKSWDDDPQQLNDDRRRDVGHDAQREDRQLQQSTTREQVHEVKQRGLGLLRHTALHGLRVDAGRRNERPEPEHGHDEQGKEQLPTQVGGTERLGKCTEQGFLLRVMGSGAKAPRLT